MRNAIGKLSRHLNVGYQYRWEMMDRVMELYLYIKRCGHYMEHLWNWWCVTRSSKSHKECHVFAFLALLKGIEEIKIPIYCTRVLHCLSATIQYAINPKKERPGDLWYTNINLKHMVAHTHTHYSPPHSISPHTQTHICTYTTSQAVGQPETWYGGPFYHLPTFDYWFCWTSTVPWLSYLSLILSLALQTDFLGYRR